MLEILFSDSAAGSLKIAQAFGKKKYSPDPAGFLVIHEDGRSPAIAEIDTARQEYVGKHSKAGGSAVLMSGDANYISSFALFWSVGDIRENGIGQARSNVLNQLFCSYPQEVGQSAEAELIERTKKDFNLVCKQMDEGKAVRVWYSDQPDEACGLCWFLSEVHRHNLAAKNIRLVKLPEWIGEGDNFAQHISWGDVEPNHWHRYLNCEKKNIAGIPGRNCCTMGRTSARKRPFACGNQRPAAKCGCRLL